jgi:hypothetical protein
MRKWRHRLNLVPDLPTLWHQTRVDASGGGFSSTVDHSISIRDDDPIENKQPVDVVLHLQVAFEGFSRKAGATDLAFNASTFRHCCGS